MKRINFIIVLLISFSIGCGLNKPDPIKAKELVEKLLADLKANNYANLNLYYTDTFNDSEPLDKKTEKYQKMKDALGNIDSYEFVDSKESNQVEGVPALNLTYKVKYGTMTLNYSFIIIKDEGKHKITFQNMETKN